MDSWEDWEQQWQSSFSDLAAECVRSADSGHAYDHIQRVAVNARLIGRTEGASAYIVLPAAWLHDCVPVAKDSPLRNQASRLAADHAAELLHGIDYPAEFSQAIHHAIVAHSFSARIPCETIEARVLQDADRLEALGAIGMARCFMTAAAMKQELYSEIEPFPVSRIPDDRQHAIDHFFVKLLGLPSSMQTDYGENLGWDRVRVMIAYLQALEEEIGLPRSDLVNAITIHAPKVLEKVQIRNSKR